MRTKRRLQGTFTTNLPLSLAGGGSRQGQFEPLGSFGEFHGRRLKPQSKRLLRIGNRLLLRVSGGSTAWQFSEDGRPTFGFGVERNAQTKFHAGSLARPPQSCNSSSTHNRLKPGSSRDSMPTAPRFTLN